MAAGDLLDWSHLVRWLQRYRPTCAGRPRLWSIHNYLDVNRPRSWRHSGTLKLLRLTRGELWITETAGVVVSRRYPKYDEQRAAAATRRMSTSRALPAHHPPVLVPVAGGLRPLRLGLGVVPLERLGPAGLARGRGRGGARAAR